jgi:PASTA domain
MNIAGHKISGWWVVGGIGGAGVGWIVYKRSQASSAAAASTAAGSPGSIDPVTGLPYSQDNQVDPATGLTYLQEAQEYGSVQAAEEAVTSGEAYYGDTGAGDELDSGYPTGYYGTEPTTPTPGSYETNAQWAQAVTAGLTDLGYNATDVTAALGLYFQSQPLGVAPDGASYLSIVQAAVAEYGPPPVGTFQIVGSGGGGTPPPTTTTSVKLPDYKTQRVEDVTASLSELGLTGQFSPPLTSRKPNVAYYVTSQSPGAGATVSKGSTVDLGIGTKP